ncbi:hypothetical protein H257_09540 [Aphanomyces astaci]|uniref:Uncharacterized protein n=1 Tax=Aphanomyces astaci TaxID=112090 RepID=W4GC59_APHAT|nr:hypothetical protein H257_09540 [Aphanomyces astaci]ETV76538.1 hypothetical protein H257_09540 [Aphanomyces astaci]|eukprot:XP_009834083.1 hypothetical protein H257_09540 [Aphanomyces astaci]
MVAKSIEVMGVIMNYPRRKFASYARILLPALDLFQLHALPIDAMMDELKLTIEAATNKVPASLAQGGIYRCIAKQNKNVSDATPDMGLKKAGVEAMVTLVTSSLQAGRMVKATLDVLEKHQPRSFKAFESAMVYVGVHWEAAEDRRPSYVPKQQASSAPQPSTITSVPKHAKTPSAASLARASSSSGAASKQPTKPATMSSSSSSLIRAKAAHGGGIPESKLVPHVYQTFTAKSVALEEPARESPLSAILPPPNPRLKPHPNPGIANPPNTHASSPRDGPGSDANFARSCGRKGRAQVALRSLGTGDDVFIERVLLEACADMDGAEATSSNWIRVALNKLIMIVY